MRRYIWLALLAAIFCFLPAGVSAASDPQAEAKANAGRILIDVAAHGEAWYVNPQSLARVYLGRPHEALERLQKRAIYVNFWNISRLAESDGMPNDVEYAKAVAGYVLSPDDLLGAAWYVSPSLGLRLRLATPDDAWLVMKTGVAVSSAVLKAIPIETETEVKPVGEHAVKKIVSADTLDLDDGSRVRLISVDVPSNPDLQQAAMDRIASVIGGRTVMLETDVKDTDAAGNKLRFVRAGDVNLNYDLVRNGLAFHNIEFPNYRYAEQLIVGGLDAMNQKKGFWQPEQ
jgi:endonuclease YncB( thermonuclease family)